MYPSRDWIWNTINANCHSEFKQFTDKKISECAKYYVSKKNINKKVLPESVNILNHSIIYLQRGRSFFLLKIAGKLKCDEVKEVAEQLRNYAMQNQLLEEKIINMQEIINEHAKNQGELLENRGKLVKSYQEGNIDSDYEYKDNNHE